MGKRKARKWSRIRAFGARDLGSNEPFLSERKASMEKKVQKFRAGLFLRFNQCCVIIKVALFVNMTGKVVFY